MRGAAGGVVASFAAARPPSRRDVDAVDVNEAHPSAHHVPEVSLTAELPPLSLNEAEKQRRAVQAQCVELNDQGGE